MSLQDYRQEIDLINLQIVKCLSLRLDLTAKVAEYKKIHKLPVLDADREVRMFEKLYQESQTLGLSVDLVRRVFEVILEETHKQEAKIIKT